MKPLDAEERRRKDAFRLDQYRTLRSVDDAVGEILVAPTAAELAGVEAPGADGASLLPLLADPSAPWRADFLLEYLERRRHRLPTYCGVRTDRYVYVVYRTGEAELYDLTADPYQLTNLAAVRAMAAEEHRLRSRLLQLCDPPPPGLTLTGP